MGKANAATGVLLLQLGTPDAPTEDAVRPYLREFLGDPRVIETQGRFSRFAWWCVLNFSVLRKRPAESAAKYQRIWHPQTGSPLLFNTRKQAEGLQKSLGDGFNVRFAMRYGNPSIRNVVPEMIAAGIERLMVLPMYPQYSATSTASALDALFLALTKERRVPALQVIASYHDHPAYIDAMAGIIEGERARLSWEPDLYLLSFHGIPISYTERGDPYAMQVKETTERLVERLSWREGQWRQTFQSQFGKEEWLQPYTEATLKELAQQGVRRVFVATPGFTADCLETIDEIGNEYREAFVKAGGQELHRCPCLNDHPLWIEGMRRLVVENR